MWSYYSSRSVSPITTASSSSANTYTDSSLGLGGQTISGSLSGSREFIGGLSSRTRITYEEEAHFTYVNNVGLTSAVALSSNRFSYISGDHVYSSWFSNADTVSQTINGTSFFSSSSSLTESGTALISQTSASYNYTTTASTSTGSVQSTSTSTRTSAFLSTSTTSVTTTGAPTSTSATTSANSSSADTFTTSTTRNTTKTFTTYSSTTASTPFYLDLIAEADTNDWAWEVTTSGSGLASDVGSSFTKTTFTAQGVGTSTVVNYYNPFTDLATSYSYSRPSFSSTTTTSTVSTTTISTYSTAASTVGSVPFSSVVGATINYTTSRATTFTFSHTSTTTTASINLNSITTTATSSSTVTTTYALGTSTMLVTWTHPSANSVTRASGSASFTNATRTQMVADAVSVVSAGLLNPWRSVATSLDAARFSMREITIGAGYQSPQAIGRTEPIGTNLSPGSTTSTTTNSTTTMTTTGGINSTVGSLGLGWPRTDRVPIIEQPSAINIGGSVPITLTNSRTSTAGGGYGWNSTESTLVSVSSGAHQITTANSTTTGSFTTSWTSTDSTMSIGTGEQFVAEVIPLIRSVLGNTYLPFANFSAFPPTTA